MAEAGGHDLWSSQRMAVQAVNIVEMQRVVECLGRQLLLRSRLHAEGC